MGLRVSVEFWTDDLTGSLPETARFFSKQRVPPHPGDTLFVNEETTATRPGSPGRGEEGSLALLRVRVAGTFRVTGRFWSVPSEELTINVRPVGEGGAAVQPVDPARGSEPWGRRD